MSFTVEIYSFHFTSNTWFCWFSYMTHSISCSIQWSRWLWGCSKSGKGKIQWGLWRYKCNKQRKVHHQNSQTSQEEEGCVSFLLWYSYRKTWWYYSLNLKFDTWEMKWWCIYSIKSISIAFYRQFNYLNSLEVFTEIVTIKFPQLKIFYHLYTIYGFYGSKI